LPTHTKSELLGTLRKYWGFTTFRRFQQEIVQSVLDERDVCVVMPTGGGKSLCYQLPAAMIQRKTAVVVSPLLALMQDQVSKLTRAGIAATTLNSTVTQSQQREVMKQAQAGKFRLIYLSPERLAAKTTIDWLDSIPLSFFVFDEAHCISEWGHEFRPEYRLLNRLRDRFPKVPLAAFTASATQHVRHDIVSQLKMRDPGKFIASFYRPNLRYIVRECENTAEELQLLLRLVRKYAQQSVIVYSPTIKRVGSTVEFLKENGIAAVPYHGKMEKRERAANQEEWMSDHARVLVGTVAFGLGIDKPHVRAVIHLSLPKSVEQYYQEAGRAGRDGKSSDCILLWQFQDRRLIEYFIGEIQDEAEHRRAWQRYQDILRFVESRACRHAKICVHFGEKFGSANCKACDVCSGAPEWLGRKKEIERGAARSNGTKARNDAKELGSKARKSLAAALSAEEQRVFQALRTWRQWEAERQDTEPFVIAHDSALKAVAQMRPQNLRELQGVLGFGPRKCEAFGDAILKVVAKFPRPVGATLQVFSEVKAGSSARDTLKLLERDLSIQEIALTRGLKATTIVRQICKLVYAGEIEFREHWVAAGIRDAVLHAQARIGTNQASLIKAELPENITYDEIRLAILGRIAKWKGINAAAATAVPGAISASWGPGAARRA
jgi:ATP-dependent DNA helicase RecQ